LTSFVIKTALSRLIKSHPTSRSSSEASKQAFLLGVLIGTLKNSHSAIFKYRHYLARSLHNVRKGFETPGTKHHLSYLPLHIGSKSKVCKLWKIVNEECGYLHRKFKKWKHQKQKRKWAGQETGGKVTYESKVMQNII